MPPPFAPTGTVAVLQPGTVPERVGAQTSTCGRQLRTRARADEDEATRDDGWPPEVVVARARPQRHGGPESSGRCACRDRRRGRKPRRRGRRQQRHRRSSRAGDLPRRCHRQESERGAASGDAPWPGRERRSPRRSTRHRRCRPRSPAPRRLRLSTLRATRRGYPRSGRHAVWRPDRVPVVPTSPLRWGARVHARRSPPSQPQRARLRGRPASAGRSAARTTSLSRRAPPCQRTARTPFMPASACPGTVQR